MMKKTLLSTVALCIALAPGPVMFGQTARNIDAHKRPHLAAAQTSISNAYQHIVTAQGANKDKLGGHATKAKKLLVQAAQELKLAAQYGNKNHT